MKAPLQPHFSLILSKFLQHLNRLPLKNFFFIFYDKKVAKIFAMATIFLLDVQYISAFVFSLHKSIKVTWCHSFTIPSHEGIISHIYNCPQILNQNVAVSTFSHCTFLHLFSKNHSIAYNWKTIWHISVFMLGFIQRIFIF